MCSHHLNKEMIRQPLLAWLCEGTSVRLCPRRVDVDRRLSHSETRVDTNFSVH